MANWSIFLGLVSGAVGIWLIRESRLVATHDPQQAGGMLVVSGLFFTVAGALVLLAGIVVRVLARRSSLRQNPPPN